MAARRRITQETFDAAVRENVDTFSIPLEEALADAITQFESTGVDLGNIISDGSTLVNGDSENSAAVETGVVAGSDSKEGANPPPPVAAKGPHPVLVAIAKLRPYIIGEGAPAGDEAATASEAVAGLEALTAACVPSLENRAIAGSNLAVTYTLSALRKFHAAGNHAGTRAALVALRIMCINTDENKALVPLPSIDTLLACMDAGLPVEVQRYVRVLSALPCEAYRRRSCMCIKMCSHA